MLASSFCHIYRIYNRFIPVYCWRRAQAIPQIHKLKKNTYFTEGLYYTPQMENKIQDPCVFEYSKDDFVYQTARWDDVKAPQISKFDKELRHLWDENMEKGVFKYSMDHVKTKILPGSKKYVAQLNEKRATERRKPQTIMSVNQPFNPDLFNFQKVHANEILFSLHNTDENQSNGNGTMGSEKPERNVIIINISPLEYGHVLIVPQVDHSLPQILTETAMKVVLEAMLLSMHRGFKLGYNSLCGYASVNHLHFHAYYLEHELMVEYSDVESLGHNVYELTAMPCHGFAFQLHGSTIKELTTLICRITEYFLKNDIAHNLLITRGTVFGEPRSSDRRTIRLYLWARKKFLGSKVTHEFNVAVVELGGHLPVKDIESYNSLTEEMADNIIQETRLPEEEYKQIKDEVIQIAKQASSVQANNC